MQYALAFPALALMAVGQSSQALAQCTEADVLERRGDFNAAIENADLATIASLLAEDVFLVSGTDSEQFIGRGAQLAIWAEDFEQADRLIYRRTPASVQLSPLYPIALERGTWVGEAGNGDTVGGNYSAKWRCDGAAWFLEAEIFLTATCTGDLCPD